MACYARRLGGGGVKPELIPLTDIRGVGRARARALWDAGFRSVRAISMARPEDIEGHVKCLGPNPASAARMIIRGAKEALEKNAEQLRKEADALLEGLPST
eukprot:TRINITY_DN1583_c0_g1_i4.p2 TRINITY_DN1583_c0_g1~~TRINITY_DN1583_c0_g1_i4.p2  ORF type:complete len:101 (-),score=20.27 TRINITY_DN1583_c0_g1_i4:66-368(-)